MDASDLLVITQATLRGMDPFVPFDQGNLAGGATATPGVVHYPANYASFVHDGTRYIRQVHQDKHPRASMHWEQAYVADGARQTVEAVERVMGGRRHG